MRVEFHAGVAVRPGLFMVLGYAAGAGSQNAMTDPYAVYAKHFQAIGGTDCYVVKMTNRLNDDYTRTFFNAANFYDDSFCRITALPYPGN
jgi:hypothetical protein